MGEIVQGRIVLFPFLDTTIFLATDHIGYAKMITLWVIFVFVTTLCTGFKGTEK